MDIPVETEKVKEIEKASEETPEPGMHSEIRREKNLNALDWIAVIVSLIGNLNWGIIGIANYNVIAAIFGDMSVLTRLIYLLAAIASIYVASIAGQLVKREINEIGQM
jgi:uncharacterized protein